LPDTWESEVAATLFRHLLVALLLMPLAAVQAQQQTDDTESTEQPATGDDSAEQAPGDADTEDADLPDIDSQPIDGSQNAGPGRFIPSEQISQDFGVSFPVDI